jgi:apolipoprotein N-acyltransferase
VSAPGGANVPVDDNRPPARNPSHHQGLDKQPVKGARRTASTTDRWLPAAWAPLAGMLTATAFAPYDVGVAAVVGPAVLMAVLARRSLRGSAGLALLFGAGFELVLLSWLAESIGVTAWVVLSLVQALWFAVLGVLTWTLTACAGSWPGSAAWFGVAWVVVETGRSSWPFGGLPWGRLGYAAVDTVWQPLLPYIGVVGVSGVAAFVAGSTGVLVRHVATWVRAGSATMAGGAGLRCRWSARGVVAPALTLAVFAASLVPLLVPWQDRTSGSWVVAVVQGGVPGTGRDLVGNHRAVTANHVAGTVQLAQDAASGTVRRPDLVVWPENSTAVDPLVDPVARSGIQWAVEAVGAPVLVGGIVSGPTSGTILNQGIVWDRTGPTDQRYTKRHPVPFGEYIPFRDVLGGISPRLDEVPRDALPGTPEGPLRVGGVLVGDAICFDVAYSDVLGKQVRQGAEVAVVQTSNASFFGTSQLEQQLTITRARAAELGRAIAVASTNGVSAVIGPDGELLQRAPTRSREILVQEVPLRTGLTPAIKLGSSIPVGAGVIALAGLARLGLRRLVATGWPGRRRNRDRRG